jgi:hypothetical protein
MVARRIARASKCLMADSRRFVRTIGHRAAVAQKRRSSTATVVRLSTVQDVDVATDAASAAAPLPRPHDVPRTQQFLRTKTVDLDAARQETLDDVQGSLKRERRDSNPRPPA